MAVLIPASPTHPWLPPENGPIGGGKVSWSTSSIHRASSILPLDSGTEALLGAVVCQEGEEEASEPDRVHREAAGAVGCQPWLPCSRGKKASQVESPAEASKSLRPISRCEETT